jgi:outer membrane lipoprotein-sorting protein
MLKKVCLSIVALAVLIPGLYAQTVDEIIAKNIQARGGMDKLKSVKSIRTTATMTMGPGMEAPGVMVQKRPEMARLEFTVQGLTAVQAYDGSKAWQIMPFMGKKDPEAMSADDTKEMEENADLDGALVDYKAKGHKVELLGKEKVEGTDVYKLKVTLKNGDVQTEYIDADSFLVIKEEITRTVRGTEHVIESSIGDYKEVEGIIFPFAVENSMKGSDQKEKITVSKIELNVPADDAIFKMPPPAPVPPLAPAAAPEPPKTDKPEAPKTPPPAPNPPNN